jgi:hypothetical protein
MDLFQIDGHGAEAFPSLRARVTPDEAKQAFSGHGWSALPALGMFSRSRFRSMAEVYVPYHLFRVTISDAGRHQTSYFALDAVTGTLDLYQFEDKPQDLRLVRSRNRVRAAVDAEGAWPLLVGKLQRALFQSGFFKLRDPHLSGQIERTDLHVPYWIGFYERGPRVRLRVLDAVRRKFEGGKARALFERWLAEDRPSTSEARI